MVGPIRRRARQGWRPRTLAPLLAGLLAVPPLPRGGGALAADPQPYQVSIAKTGDAALDAALSGSSQLVSLRERAPVGPFALITRAQSDRDRLRTALESFGYYAPVLRFSVDGHPLADPDLPAAIAAIPKGQDAQVRVEVERGPLFHVGHVEVKGALPSEVRATLGVAPGDAAVASSVLAGSGAMRTALQERGHALATVSDPVAYLRPDTRTLDLVYTVDEGPRVDIGPITLTGLGRVDPGFVRRRLLVHEGDLWQPSRIEAARTDLAGLGVFSSVEAKGADAVDARGELPLAFAFTERRRHAVSLGVAYSTDLGASVTATWSDRNLFGQAEQLNLSVSAGAGGTAVRGTTYNATAQFLKPDFLRRDQQLELDLGALKQNLIAYDQTAVTAGASVHRKLSKEWTVSAGVSAEQEQILQQGTTRDYTLIGLPLSAQYDGTGLADPLSDPTHGVRAAVTATPTYSLAGAGGFFAVLQGSASTYFDLADIGLTAPGRSVIAVRALVGSDQGVSNQFALPPDQRFYGGGSATVRGYRYQGVSPYFAGTTTPTGGAAIDAGTIEFRQRVYGPVGAAVFVDAGQVSANSAPFTGTLRVGAGRGRAILHLARADPAGRGGAAEQAAGRGLLRALHRPGAGVLMGGIGGRKKGSASFLKKRSKKLLPGCLGALGEFGASGPKVFWFFFSKKNCLLSFSGAPR